MSVIRMNIRGRNFLVSVFIQAIREFARVMPIRLTERRLDSYFVFIIFTWLETHNWPFFRFCLDKSNFYQEINPELLSRINVLVRKSIPAKRSSSWQQEKVCHIVSMHKLRTHVAMLQRKMEHAENNYEGVIQLFYKNTMMMTFECGVTICGF